ncbi:glycosyltransferase family 2 protein [Lichenibacterium dinghuense]|uniref:glycosyltransferase family 2 protein n=1 Tax=Lichenibacterium dinghuense TaxID=2895977 RepID=UPI001F171BE1|nr:glycosyltransferase family 2 protein [Lichenibacterium sp. 6Y81]
MDPDLINGGQQVLNSIPNAVPSLSKLDRNVAVLVPCFNEALTVGQVVRGFISALPEATIYVYDNNSSDRTADIARSAGAVVRLERRQGKGNVVRRMFADVDAACYVMVDGDDTYDPAAAAEAVKLVTIYGYDFVNIARKPTDTEVYRRGHRIGNKVLTQTVRSFFGRDTSDMLSGYKVMSRRFVKSFPAMSSGFETETELTVHALEMRMPMHEICAAYKDRPKGSISKLRTYRDGVRIILLIARLVKDERPFGFFGTLGALIGLFGVALGIPVVLTFFETGLVPRLPTAVLSVGLVMIGWLAIFTGIILDVVTKARQEFKRIAYLSIGRSPTL